jgi:membrane associated rhomboid family serine protease
VIPLRDANPTRRTPVVTLALIAACFVVFAYELGRLGSGGMEALDAFATEWGIVPARLTAAWSTGTNLPGEALTLITSQFLHGGWLHLLGNMLYLWIFGNNVEDRLGRLRFLVFYLVGGVVAGLAQVAIAPGSPIPTIGASGAIAATLGAYLVLFPRARITSLVFLGFFYQLIDVPAIIVLVFWFVLQLVDGIASLGVTDAGGGVAFFAHIGGFVFGVVVGLIARAAGGRRRQIGGPDGRLDHPAMG